MERALFLTLSLPPPPQLSIVVDGGKKTVEFSFVGLLKNTLRYTFRSRDLHALFDRQWHKLSISVQSNIVSIYMDCKLVERRLTDERDSIDPSGRTLITTRVEDGRPVDVRPVQPKLRLISSNLNALLPALKLHCVIVLTRASCPTTGSDVISQIFQMPSNCFEKHSQGAYFLNVLKSSFVLCVNTHFQPASKAYKCQLCIFQPMQIRA